MARQVPVGVWLDFVEDAYEKNLFNEPDQVLYEDLFPRTATVIPPPTPVTQHDRSWHRYWVFLNLVESLIDLVKPVTVSQPAVTRDASGYQVTDNPVHTGFTLRQFQPPATVTTLNADVVNGLLPTVSIQGREAAAHCWCSYDLPGGDTADFAVAFTDRPVTFEPGVVAKLTPQHLNRVTCTTENGALWRLQANGNGFAFNHVGMPRLLVDAKLGEEEWETQSPLQAHMQHEFTRVIASDRWKHAPDLPERYTEIRNDGDMLNGAQLQDGLQTVFQEQLP